MKLDLSALPPEQIEAIRAITDPASECLTRANREYPGLPAGARREIKKAAKGLLRITVAISAAQRAKQKGST